MCELKEPKKYVYKRRVQLDKNQLPWFSEIILKNVLWYWFESFSWQCLDDGTAEMTLIFQRRKVNPVMVDMMTGKSQTIKNVFPRAKLLDSLWLAWFLLRSKRVS